MEKTHINICVEREVSDILNKAKELTGFSKSELIKRYACMQLVVTPNTNSM